jgi:hypothetical protein
VRLWGTYYGGSEDDHGRSCATDGSGNVYLAGWTSSANAIASGGYQNYGGGYSDAFLVKFNTNGVRQWGTYYGGSNFDILYSCTTDSIGNVYLAGETGSTNSIASGGHQNTHGGVYSDAFLVKFKQPRITGLVWQDLNTNCTKDTSEAGVVSGINLTIQPGNYITQSIDGIYSLDSLPAGTYTVTADTTNRNWILTCPVSQTFTVTNPNGFTLAPNFGFKSKYPCPKPDVSVVMPRMRRGFNNQLIYFEACNLSTATDILNGAYVEVQLPSNITVQSGSLTYTSIGGNKYRVNIGTLYPGQCVNFTFNATVTTAATANQTLCLSAELFPQANCVFDSIPAPYQPGSPVNPCLLPYDNSLLVVRATCANDSVRLVVKNVAPAPDGNMVCYSPVRIYLNGALYFQDSVKLNGGDSVIYVFAGGNQTWHIEADNHPLNYRANPTQSTFIELCGTGNWTPGIANTLPQPDALPVTDIYCGQVTAPLDPNDKTGFPLGVGATHDILRNKEIEYLIRFQNVGTDTAVNVVIRDTLTTDLDIFSVRSGVSSHPYEFSMYGQRVLEWKFNNIMLPDSNTNEPASNGFVKFMVKQNKDLPYGTVIENTAAIYFDFEAPVITNTYFHTVSPPQQVVSSIAAISVDNLKVIVAPNPMHNTATVTIENFENKGGAEWQLYDLSGRIAQTAVKFNGNRLSINRNDLKAGMYLYRIMQQEKTIAIGRIVLE